MNNKQLIKEIITDFNEIAGTKYNPDKPSAEIVKMINGRVSEGYTIDDFRKVHRTKYREWRGTDQIKYFRPTTLYRPTHFAEYLNVVSDEVAPVVEEVPEDPWNGFVTWAGIPVTYRQSHWNEAMKHCGVSLDDLHSDDYKHLTLCRGKVIRYVEYLYNKEIGTVSVAVLNKLLNNDTVVVSVNTPMDQEEKEGLQKWLGIVNESW